MPVKPIPEGFHSVTPYLLVNDASKLMDFLKAAFGAQETVRMPGPDGKVAHAETRIGDSVVMMGTPPDGTARPAALYLYLDDVDASYKRALAAGGRSTEEPADMFYGDRRAGIQDPCDNIWWIAKHVEDVSPEQMQERQKAAAH